MKQIDKFISKYGHQFDPLLFRFDGETYIPYQHNDGTVSYHHLPSTAKERTVTHRHTYNQERLS